jgi:hypothetical protein
MEPVCPNGPLPVWSRGAALLLVKGQSWIVASMVSRRARWIFSDLGRGPIWAADMKVSASDVLHALEEAVRGRLEDPLLLDALLGVTAFAI